MTDTLRVHVNREGIHDVGVPETFEATGSFAVRLHNHGEPVHVHLHADDALSNALDFDGGNYYLEADATRTVDVPVDEARVPVEGTLTVQTGHGSTGDAVRVSVVEPEYVTVDESLGRPPTDEPEPSASAIDHASTAAVAVAAVALVVLVAVFVDEAAAVVLGALAVLGGVGVAVYLLSSS